MPWPKSATFSARIRSGSQIDMIYEEAHAAFGNYDEKDDEE